MTFPSLIVVRIPSIRANATSPIVLLPVAGVMALGTITAWCFGAHFAQHVPQWRVRSLITTIGLIISAVMFYRHFH